MPTIVFFLLEIFR